MSKAVSNLPPRRPERFDVPHKCATMTIRWDKLDEMIAGVFHRGGLDYKKISLFGFIEMEFTGGAQRVIGERHKPMKKTGPKLKIRRK